MEAQNGWRYCRTCQGLISINIGSGNCLDGSLHDFTYSAEYRAVWSEFAANVQRGWGVCSRCARLSFVAPGTCWDGAPHQYDEFSPEFGVPFGPGHQLTEPGWRWCSRCQCLNNTNNPSHRCFKGGDHDFNGSFEYSVPVIKFGIQTWWTWCTNCQGLFQGVNTGGRHDGNPHQWGGAETYGVAYGFTAPGTQGGWRLCTKCSLLALGGGATGACYKGGEHDFTGTLTYSIPKDTIPDGAQPGWRCCSKCQLLGYNQFAPAPCPAGEAHDYSASGAYGIYPESLSNGQPGWRKCGKCKAMVLTQLSHGQCRDGSPHDVATGDSYEIPLGIVPIGAESSWRCCSRCQALTYGGNPGVCFDGALHELGVSPLYGVPIDSPPEGAQSGWHRCTRCQQLVAGEPGGVCDGGAPHDVTGSAEYSVAVKAPAPPPPPTGPRLVVTETAASITVDGTGFGGGANVELSFIVGAATLKVSVVCDAEGAFHHVTNDAVASPTGGLLLAKSDSGKVASARLKSVVPPVPG